MADLTRRGFLTQSSIAAGVALAGGVALRQLVPGSSKAGYSSSSSATAVAAAAVQPAVAQQGQAFTSTSLGGVSLQQPLVVHVRDASTGEISLMVGMQELVYRDPELVARLVQTASATGAVGA